MESQPTGQNRPSLLSSLFSFSLLSLCSALVIYRYDFYLSDTPVPSEDLPGHIALLERYIEQLNNFRLTFYDPYWFTGWPAFQFYGFLPHLAAAVFGTLLYAFSDDSYILSIHLLALFSTALLPFSVYFASLPLWQKLVEDQERNTAYAPPQWLLALSCAVLSFWFLNSDQQFIGLGAGAVLVVGLFSQSFGWHLMLLHLGLILRYLNKPSKNLFFGISICSIALLIGHTLTAFFSFFLAAFIWLWFAEHRRSIFLMHLAAVLTTCFWLLPFLAFSGEYASQDAYPPQGDLLQIIFRYPVQILIEEFRTSFLSILLDLNPSHFLIALMSIIIITKRKLRESAFTQFMGAFILLSTVVFSSGYVAASIPLAVHYYRLKAYIILLLICLLTAAPSSTLLTADYDSTAGDRAQKLGAWVLLLFLCLYQSFALPTLEQQRSEKLASENFLKNQKALLSYLKKENKGGRVFIEHLNDYKRFPALSCHYILANLSKETGLETINGLFIESSLSYRIPVYSAASLGAKTYHSYIPQLQMKFLDKDTALNQLTSLGVRYVIASEGKFLKNLEKLISPKIVPFGPYRLVEFPLPSSPIVETLDSEQLLVGYHDAQNNLPYSHFEAYFYANSHLSSSIDLIDLPSLEHIPPGLSAILLNSSREDFLNLKSQIRKAFPKKPRPKPIAFSYPTPHLLDPAKREYPLSFAPERFKRLKRYLGKKSKLKEKLNSLIPVNQNARRTLYKPTLEWDEDYQSFNLKGLTTWKINPY